MRGNLEEKEQTDRELAQLFSKSSELMDEAAEDMSGITTLDDQDSNLYSEKSASNDTVRSEVYYDSEGEDKLLPYTKKDDPKDVPGFFTLSDSDNEQDTDDDRPITSFKQNLTDNRKKAPLKRRKSLTAKVDPSVPMTYSDRNIVASNLDGLSDTQAKDIEQILHIKLLVKFFLHRELSEFNGGRVQKTSYLRDKLNFLNDQAPNETLSYLTRYLDEHNESSGQRNILSSVILVTYQDEFGEKFTSPYRLSNARAVYNILSHNNEEFRLFMQEAHALDSSCAMHDFHTEAALMLLLKQDIENIKATYHNRVERITICIDSRLSGCNRCVEKIQTIRTAIANDPMMTSPLASSSSHTAQKIRCSVSFSSTRKFTGDMGYVAHDLRQGNTIDQEGKSPVRKKLASEQSTAPLTVASPMIVSGDAPFKTERYTHPHRSPNKKIFLGKIALSSTEFISGSTDSKRFSSTVTDLLNEASRSIDHIINKIIDALFIETLDKTACQKTSGSYDDSQIDYFDALAQGAGARGSSSSGSPTHTR